MQANKYSLQIYHTKKTRESILSTQSSSDELSSYRTSYSIADRAGSLGAFSTCTLLSSHSSSSSSDDGMLIKDIVSESLPFSDAGFEGAVIGDKDMSVELAASSGVSTSHSTDDLTEADWGMTIDEDASEPSDESSEQLFNSTTVMLGNKSAAMYNCSTKKKTYSIQMLGPNRAPCPSLNAQ